MTLRETLAEYRRTHRALAHFNISDSNQLKAIAEAARAERAPVVIGLSEGERAFFPLSLVRALIDAYRADGVELFLNADHTYSIEKAREAIDAGVDSIVIDGAQLPLEQNIELARACVAYARRSDRDVVVEGEIGYIGTSSQVLDALPEGAATAENMMTSVDDLVRFIQETGVDAMAPAVGNVHGMVKGGNPRLSIDRIEVLADSSPVPLVLHGGSGVSDEEFTQAIKAGIAEIHINTELRLAYRHGIERGLISYPHEASPYKYFAPAVEDMMRVVQQRIRLFKHELSVL